MLPHPGVPLDQRLYLLLFGGETVTAFTHLVIAITALGSGWVMVLLIPMLVVRKTRDLAASLAVTLLPLAVVVWAIKLAVGRRRPFVGLGIHPVIDAPTDFSFPSGHATGSFAVAGFVVAVCLARPSMRGRGAIAIATVALATAIALSRVYLGVHYPGDVFGGALIGGAAGFVGGRWHCSRRRPEV